MHWADAASEALIARLRRARSRASHCGRRAAPGAAQKTLILSSRPASVVRFDRVMMSPPPKSSTTWPERSSPKRARMAAPSVSPPVSAVESSRISPPSSKSLISSLSWPVSKTKVSRWVPPRSRSSPLPPVEADPAQLLDLGEGLEEHRRALLEAQVAAVGGGVLGDEVHLDHAATRAQVEVARETGRVVQVGTHRRSGLSYADAANLVASTCACAKFIAATS